MSDKKNYSDRLAETITYGASRIPYTAVSATPPAYAGGDTLGRAPVKLGALCPHSGREGCHGDKYL